MQKMPPKSDRTDRKSAEKYLKKTKAESVPAPDRLPEQKKTFLKQDQTKRKKITDNTPSVAGAKTKQNGLFSCFDFGRYAFL